MQLGMVTLDDYLAYWGNSYVLAIASYNAGPTNVRKWVEIFGDPRDSSVDPIDWIERSRSRKPAIMSSAFLKTSRSIVTVSAGATRG